MSIREKILGVAMREFERVLEALAQRLGVEEQEPRISVALHEEPPPLPTAEQSFCFRCGRRVSHPHFSIEEVPKIFCTWFCSNKHHQVARCGVYKTTKESIVIVEMNERGYNISIDTQTKRPRNHPIVD